MKEAYLYKKLADNKVQCFACNHRCMILDGKRGICGVRENQRGILYSLVYEKPVSVHVDNIEKKPLYHFLPGTKSFSFGTVGCSYRCKFCQNWEMSQSREIINQDTTVQEIINSAKQNNCKSISYTYSEPTIFIEFAYDTAKLAVKNKLKNVFVTNGYYTKETLKLIKPYLHAANIDLKSFSDKFYRENCGARLEPVLESIKATKKAGIWLELTTLLIPGKNDSKKEIKEIANFIVSINKNIPWHISRFFPHYKLNHIPPTDISFLQDAYKIGKEAGLNYVYLGNIQDKKYESTYCPRCAKTVIERIGYSTNNLLKNNKCPYCSQKIEGVFNAE